MTWTHIGTDDYRPSTTTSGQTAWTFGGAGVVGDLCVIEFLTISSTISISSLSGGGVTTWQRAGSVNAVASTTIGVAANAELWYGLVTSTATALTITYSATIGSTSCRALRRGFRSSRVAAGQAQYKVSGNAYTQTSGHVTASPLTWPSLTTTRDHQLVVGVMGDFGSTTWTGATTGYTYTSDSDVNWHMYRLLAAGVEVEAATMTASGSDGWYVMQTIFDDGYVPPSQSYNQAVQRACLV